MTLAPVSRGSGVALKKSIDKRSDYNTISHANPSAPFSVNDREYASGNQSMMSSGSVGIGKLLPDLRNMQNRESQGSGGAA